MSERDNMTRNKQTQICTINTQWITYNLFIKFLANSYKCIVQKYLDNGHSDMTTTYISWVIKK